MTKKREINDPLILEVLDIVFNESSEKEESEIVKMYSDRDEMFVGLIKGTCELRNRHSSKEKVIEVLASLPF